MKHLWLILTTFSLLALSGCGSSSTSDSDSSDTSVAYDLSQYIIPTKSQTNVYLNRVYEKDDPQEVYMLASSTSINETYEVNTSLVQVSTGDTYSISDGNISIFYADDNETHEISRMIKVGNTAISYTSIKLESGIEFIINYDCRLTAHLDEKVLESAYIEAVHNDVLLFDCKEDESGVGAISDMDVRVEGRGAMKHYFAKDTGLISSLKESCTDVTLGSNTSTDCEKTEVELFTVVE